jgi:hypothetical protein
MLYLASEVDNEYIYHGFYDNGIYRCVRLEKTNAMLFYITENDIDHIHGDVDINVDYNDLYYIIPEKIVYTRNITSDWYQYFTELIRIKESKVMENLIKIEDVLKFNGFVEYNKEFRYILKQNDYETVYIRYINNRYCLVNYMYDYSDMCENNITSLFSTENIKDINDFIQTYKKMFL